MKKIVMITTVPLSLGTLVKGQAKYLSQFYEVKLVSSFSPDNREISDYEGVEFNSINMTRKITVFQDLKSLWEIYTYMLNEKPDMVYTFTPKAGLLGMIAAFLARVPVRIHNVVGMPLMEAKGVKKVLLKFIEQLTYFFTTKLMCNSLGLKAYIQEHLTSKDISVVGQGSVNGVDTSYFENTIDENEKKKIKEEYGINENDFVLTFVGRMVKDKGVNELVESFMILAKSYQNLKLLLVGDYEASLSPLTQQTVDEINTSSDIISVGFQKDIRKFLCISDLFVLPSYREGLPNSLIEAGSYGVPLIATDINGCNEIIIDKETGVLVEKKSVSSLVSGISLLLEDKVLYNEIKSNVRASMIKRYDQKYFWKALKDELESNF